MKKSKLDRSLVQEFEDLKKEHDTELAILEAGVHFLQCPTCGKLPEVLSMEDPYEMCKVILIGCTCRKKIELKFYFEDTYKNMEPLYLAPYYIKFDVAEKWNEQVVEVMHLESY